MAIDHDYENSVRHVGPRGWLPIAAVGLIALVLLVGLGEYFRRERIEAAEPNPTTVAAITASPEAYFGRAATINGRVTRVLGPQHYAVTDSGGELLVNSPNGLPAVGGRPHYPVLAPGDGIRVMGEIEKVEIPRNRRAVPADVLTMTGRPVIVAYESSVTSPAQIASNVRPPAQHVAAVQRPRLTDLGKISSDSSALIGHRVQAQNATVERVISDRGFWVALPRGERLFCRLHRGLDDGDMEWMVQVKERQLATLNGILSDPPSASYMDRYWGLTAEEAAEVAAYAAYLSVDGITLSRQSP